MSLPFLDQRPILVALAGPNGAGKTTFYHSQLKAAALRFVNADLLSRELNMDPYAAARMADALRRELVRQGEGFVFETVFSDPVGAKLEFLNDAVKAGYKVVVCFIGLRSTHLSEERVGMRVTQGGHDVPTEKLLTRFPRTLGNLQAAIRELPHVLIFDNSDLSRPFRQVATFENGKLVSARKPLPRWLRLVLASSG